MIQYVEDIMLNIGTIEKIYVAAQNRWPQIKNSSRIKLNGDVQVLSKKGYCGKI